MATYLRLFPATTQFELTNGQLNVAGRLYVYFEGTDDLADVYDEDGTQLANPVILDNDGRAAGLFVDASKVYRLKVCDRFDAQVFPVRKMVPCGGGAGSALGKSYEVVSSDGTVEVQTYSDAGVITFDLSTSIEQQASPYGGFIAMASSVEGDDEWHEVPVVSSQGDITYMGGWNVMKDCVGDIAASLEMTSGDPVALHTIDVMCMFMVDGTAVTTEYGMLDPTEPSGRVTFEWKGSLSDDSRVDVKFFVRSSGAATVGLIGRALYNEEVEGVIGNGGGGGGGEYYGGDYIEIDGQVINATGLQPVSGMSSYVTRSAFDSCCSSMSGYVSSLSSDVSALSAEVSSITGLTGDYVEKSAISAQSAVWNEASGISSKLDASASGEFYTTSNPSGFITGVDLSDYATTAYVDSSVSGKVDESAYTAFTSQASSDISGISSVVSGITGDWSGKADQSALDLKLDKSASSNFYPMTGNPSGFLTEHQELSGYVEKSAISAESAQWNEVSAKADTSALTAYQPVSAMSGYQPSGDYAYNSSVSAKQDASAMSAYALSSDVSGVIDTVSTNSATWAGGATGDYVEKSSTEVTIGSANTAQYTSMAQGDSNLASAGFSFAQGSVNTAADVSLAQGVRNSAAYTSLAQGFAASARGNSVAQGSRVSAISRSFAQGEGISASGTSFAQGDHNIAVGTSVAIGQYLRAANRMVAFGEYNISGDDLALVIGDGWYMPGEDHPHNLFEVKKNGDIVLYSGSADTVGWSVKNAVNAKLDASASSKFYSTSNPSGFITGIPTSYATKDYVDSSVSGKADTSSLTAYQLSGDYAYNSSLSSYALSADVSGVIDTVSANSATWAGISSDYVEKSAISAKSSVWNSASAIPKLLPKSAIEGSASVITAISGSAILGGYYVEKTASNVLIGSSNVLTPPLPGTSTVNTLVQGFNNSGAMHSLVQGSLNKGVEAALAQGSMNTAESAALAQGNYNRAVEVALSQGRSNSANFSSLAQGVGNSASWVSLSQGILNSAYGTSFVQGVSNSARAASMAQGSGCIATDTSIAVGHENSAEMQSFAQGKWNSAKNRAAVFGICNLNGDGDTATGHSAALVIGDGTSKTARHDLMLVTKDGEITMYSSTADTTGTGIMSSIRALSAAASSVIDSATVSAIASSYAESAASGKLDSSASSSFYPVDNPSGFITSVDLTPYQLTADMSAYQPSGDYYSASNPSGFITGVDLSDYATTAYVDSSVSGKLDTTAFNSGDFYSTANPSGFITGVDLSPYQLTADMSGYIPTSESANYQQSSAMTAYQLSGDYAYNSALSGYIPTSESANYQPSGDYAYNSALTAYQPSGDYIYASALGTGEI